MERDMIPWLKPQIEEERCVNNIPPHIEDFIPNLQIHTQQQNIVDPSDPNTYALMHNLSSSFSMPPPKSNFSNLLNTNNNINISGTTTTTTTTIINNDNNNPFGNVFNLEAHGACQPPLSIPRFTSTWLKEFEKEMGENGNGKVERGLNYDSNDTVDVGKIGNHGKNEVINYNGNNNVGGSSNNNIIDNNDDEDCVVEEDRKGKKKENPSKSRMAEKRRRQKLTNRMHMLRSAVPKITQMNKVSILGDAIGYLKELQQQVNDLQSELELCPSNVSSLKNQLAKVEVGVGEGGIFNIHMFCASKPGVLLSTMRALDSLGLDVHQANISCFNDFSLDVFKAEQHILGQKLAPEQIKAALLNSIE